MKFSNRVVIIIILVFIALLHASYLPNGFNWLDHGDIELGRTMVPMSSMPLMFISRFGQTGFYRPMITLLHNVDFVTYGQNAMGFHLTNVLLHMGVVLATPFFLSVFFKLTFSEQLFSMAIVGVAPIQWLPVGAISYRPEIMYTLFTMLTIWCYRFKPNHIFLLFVYAMYALFSKETAVVIIPLLLLVVEFMQKSGPEKKKESKSSIASYFKINRIVLLVSIVIYFLLRFISVPEVWRVHAPSLSFSEAIGTRFVVVGKLAAQIFSPLIPKLSDATYHFQMNHIFSLLTVIALFGSIYYIVRHSLSNPFARVLALFWISLLPAFQIIPAPRFSSSHYGYFAITILPMFFILLNRYAIKNINNLWILQSLRSLRMTYATLIIIIWIIVASYSTFMGGFRFKNDRTLFETEVKHDDNFLEGHQYLGDYFFHSNDLKRASHEYERALKIDKNIIAYVDPQSVLNNLAGVRLMENRLEEADSILSSLQKIQGGTGTLGIRYNRALIAYKQKKHQKVVDLLYSSYKEWRRPEPIFLLAESLKKLGKEKEANEIMKKMKLSK